ncbi:hypothetical protein CK203_042188 [Vitis vinifera]|uniref:Uncharacterized protein n=1 Tax=Vitis vinifera TaxID=29760 RepID=A0A438HPY5_VITVI|nr:hypothetical protein CK203_042188 [Vitis vinifera]
MLRSTVCCETTTSYPRPRAHQTYSFCFEDLEIVLTVGWDYYESEPIVVDESYEVDGVISDSRAFAPFRLVPDTPPL